MLRTNIHFENCLIYKKKNLKFKVEIKKLTSSGPPNKKNLLILKNFNKNYNKKIQFNCINRIFLSVNHQFPSIQVQVQL